MSIDEIGVIREDIAALKAVMDERAKTTERNGTLLRTVAAVVFLQFIATVFVAGVKTQKLDSLAEEVSHIRTHMEAQSINK